MSRRRPSLSMRGMSNRSHVFFKWNRKLQQSSVEIADDNPNKRLYQYVGRIVRSNEFMHFITFLIVVNSIILSLYDPTQPDSSPYNQSLEYSEIVFQLAFTIEAILLIIYFGFPTYIKDIVNKFDFLLVLAGWVDFYFAVIQASSGNDVTFSGFRMFRALRILRSLRLLKHLPGMKTLIDIVKSAASQLVAVLLLAAFVIVACAALGGDLFRDVSNIGNPGPPGIIGFEAFFPSMTTIFVVFSREGWVDIMEWVAQNNGWSRLFFIFVTAFGGLVVLNLVVTVLVVNHMHSSGKRPLGVYLNTVLDDICYKAKKREKEREIEKEAAESEYKVDEAKMRLMVMWEQSNGDTKVITHGQYLRWKAELDREYAKWKLLHFQMGEDGRPEEEDSTCSIPESLPQEGPTVASQCIQRNWRLELLFSACVLLNTIMLALQRFMQPLVLFNVLRVTCVVFGFVFFCEVWLRVVWLGGFQYWKSQPKSVKVDFVLVHVGFLLCLSGRFWSLLVFRGFSLLSPDNLMSELSKEIEKRRVDHQRLDSCLHRASLVWNKYFTEGWLFSKRKQLIQDALVRVAPFITVVVLVIHVYGVIGLHLFGGLGGKYADAYSLGYDTYLASIVTTFQIFTGEGWNTVMYASVEIKELYDIVPLVVLYYLVGICFGNFLFLKLILAIFLDTYFGHAHMLASQSSEEQVDVLEEILRKEERKRHVERRVGSRLLSLKLQASFESASVRDERRSHRVIQTLKNVHLRILNALHKYFVADWIGLSTLWLFILNSAAFDIPQVKVVCVVLFAFELALRVQIQEFGRLLTYELTWVVVLTISLFVTCDLLMAYESLIVLRFLRWSKSLRTVVRSLSNAATGCCVVVAYAFVVISIFSIFSVELFAGKTRTCVITADGSIQENKTCFDFAGQPEAAQYNLIYCPPELNCYSPTDEFVWKERTQNGLPGFGFDDYVEALQSLFEVSTLQLWNEAMFETTRIVGIGQMPRDNASDEFALYFIVVVFVGHMFLLQLFITHVIKMFTIMERNESGDAMLTENQRSWVENQIQIILQRPRRKGARSSQMCFRFVDSKAFEKAIMMIVLLDTVMICLQHKNQPEWITQMTIVNTYLFGLIYLGEAVLKIFAYGADYFRSVRNLFDFAIVLFTLVSMVSITYSGTPPVLSSLRVLRLAGLVSSLRVLLRLLGASATSFFPVLGLLSITMYVYSTAGQIFFKDTSFFNDTLSSLVTLYILAIGDDWNLVMRKIDAELDSPTSSAVLNLFTISYVFLVTLTVINLLIVVMLKVFEQEFLRKSLSQHSLTMYRREWFKAVKLCRESLHDNIIQGQESHDDHHEQSRISSLVRELAVQVTNDAYLPPEAFPALMAKLKPPLGVVDFSQGEFTVVDTLKLIHLAKIPITLGNMVNYNSALFALSDFRYRVNTGEEISDDLKTVAIELRLKKSASSGGFLRLIMRMCSSEDVLQYFNAMREESNPNYFLSHYLAAVVIQKAFRMWRTLSGNQRVLRSTLMRMGWNGRDAQPQPRQVDPDALEEQSSDIVLT